MTLLIAASRSVPPLAAGASAGPANDVRHVTTVPQAARVALDRTRRLTVLGWVPGLGWVTVLWLFPLHLLIVGLTAGNIWHTPTASLSLCDGRPARRHPATVLAALACAATLLLCLSAVLRGSTWRGSIQHGSSLLGPIGVVVLVLPCVVELLALVLFAVTNPEWLTLKRVRRRRADGRTTYVLTSLVARRDGCDHAGQLMRQVYPQWHEVDAVVIGYPASRALVSYYVRMGACREGTRDFGGSAARRRLTFDCRRPMRRRH